MLILLNWHLSGLHNCSLQELRDGSVSLLECNRNNILQNWLSIDLKLTVLPALPSQLRIMPLLRLSLRFLLERILSE